MVCIINAYASDNFAMAVTYHQVSHPVLRSKVAGWYTAKINQFLILNNMQDQMWQGLWWLYWNVCSFYVKPYIPANHSIELIGSLCIYSAFYVFTFSVLHRIDTVPSAATSWLLVTFLALKGKKQLELKVPSANSSIYTTWTFRTMHIMKLVL